MKDFFASGHLIDVALVAVLLEVGVLLFLRARTGKGLAPVDVLGQIIAGVLLLLAVRTTVTGADYRITLVLLTASFPAHVFDLLRRSRSSRT